MSSVSRPFTWFYHEFGLESVHHSGRNAYLIIVARMCRMFAYGTNALVLALFFNELNFSDSRIGLFMTLTMIGDLVLGTVLTLVADRIGRRRIMLGGSILMVVTGLIFAVAENFWLLLLAAVVGIVSVTGGDFGPFRAIEESVLSQLTDPSTRSDVLSWYITLSTWGSAVGSEVSGRIFEALSQRSGWTAVDAYHAMFMIYAIMGIVNAAFTLLLTKECELDAASLGYARVQTDEAQMPVSTSNTSAPSQIKKGSAGEKWNLQIIMRSFRRSFSEISRNTLVVMYKLWLLLAVDSLADGMVPYSLTNYYLDIAYHPSKATLGDITSVSYLLGAISSIFAAPLARRIGLVNTMVFTHVPSSAAVLLFAFPNILWISVVLLFVRAGLNNMDQAPRSAFIAAVVQPNERTAVMGITSTVRTLAATGGPLLTGFLAQNNRFWIAFVVGGILRLTYDLGLYVLFVNMKIEEYAGRSKVSNPAHDEEEFYDLESISEDLEDTVAEEPTQRSNALDDPSDRRRVQ